VNGIYRVNSAEYVIRILVAVPQEYVNLYSTHRIYIYIYMYMYLARCLLESQPRQHSEESTSCAGACLVLRSYVLSTSIYMCVHSSVVYPKFTRGLTATNSVGRLNRTHSGFTRARHGSTCSAVYAFTEAGYTRLFPSVSRFGDWNYSNSN